MMSNLSSYGEKSLEDVTEHSGDITLYNAQYYKAGHSKHYQTLVKILGNTIEVMSDGELYTYFLVDSILEPPLAKLPREVRLKDGSKLIFNVEENIEQHFKGRHNAWISVLEEKKRYIFLAFILVPIFLMLIIKYVIPTTAKTIAPLMPHSVKSQIDEHAIDAFDRLVLDESKLTNEEQLKVTKSWEQMLLAINSESSEQPRYSLLFRKSETLGANAFALPGGTVVITDELIELLKGKPEAIQAILLHEIGHVYHNHGIQMMAESLGVTLVFTYLFGDMEGITELFHGVSASVIQNTFSQSLESEADDYSLMQLKKLGISTQALADAFIALGEKHGLEEGKLEKYYSSHPSLRSRIDKAKQN